MLNTPHRKGAPSHIITRIQPLQPDISADRVELQSYG